MAASLGVNRVGLTDAPVELTLTTSKNARLHRHMIAKTASSVGLVKPFDWKLLSSVSP